MAVFPQVLLVGRWVAEKEPEINGFCQCVPGMTAHVILACKKVHFVPGEKPYTELRQILILITNNIRVNSVICISP